MYSSPSGRSSSNITRNISNISVYTWEFTCHMIMHMVPSPPAIAHPQIMAFWGNLASDFRHSGRYYSPLQRYTRGSWSENVNDTTLTKHFKAAAGLQLKLLQFHLQSLFIHAAHLLQLYCIKCIGYCTSQPCGMQLTGMQLTSMQVTVMQVACMLHACHMAAMCSIQHISCHITATGVLHGWTKAVSGTVAALTADLQQLKNFCKGMLSSDPINFFQFPNVLEAYLLAQLIRHRHCFLLNSNIFVDMRKSSIEIHKILSHIFLSF